MNGELDEFLDTKPGAGDGRPAPRVTLDLLLFAFGRNLYGVEATRVENVVQPRDYVPLPGAPEGVLGVFQDRGRVVVLMSHPTGVEAEDESEPVALQRIVVCSTEKGLVGLPASTTKAVGSYELTSDADALSVHESPFGPFTLVHPDRFGRQDP